MSLRVSFKDDILKIDMNQRIRWGCGPVRWKCAALRRAGKLQTATLQAGLWLLAWFQSQINKSQFNTCPS